ncbi:hypothetical protein LCGC14_2692720 [marine sediment metagenome]|uniref:Uncharacterized protein n=1 Tax=marine sediment metagenome TaxID=412755 RepID=A0A0F9BSP9_9ZZZZ
MNVKGQRVIVSPTSEGVRRSCPAANWIEQLTTVTLLGDCVGGTLDVVDVITNTGERESVYGFNIDKQ